MWASELATTSVRKFRSKIYLKLTNQGGQTALMIAFESPSENTSNRRGKARCALALIEATEPIRVIDFHDRAASLMLACERPPRLVVVSWPRATSSSIRPRSKS